MLFNHTPKKQKDWQENVDFTLKFGPNHIIIWHNNAKYEICKVPTDVVVRAYFYTPERLTALFKLYIPRNVRMTSNDYEKIQTQIAEHINLIA